MSLSWLELLMLSLASFRLTRLIVFDKITEFIRSPFLEEVVEINEEGEEEIYAVPKKGLFKTFLGELLSCYWCTGIWSATGICFFYLFCPNYATPFVIILAVAGLAALLETIIQRLF